MIFNIIGSILVILVSLNLFQTGRREEGILIWLSGIVAWYVDFVPLWVGVSIGFWTFIWLRRWCRMVWWQVRDQFTNDRVPMDKTVRQQAWAKWGRKCTYCGGRAEHLDHVVPYWWLENRGRTPHTVSNLRPACKRCNVLVGGRIFKNLKEKRWWVRRQLGL